MTHDTSESRPQASISQRVHWHAAFAVDSCRHAKSDLAGAPVYSASSSVIDQSFATVHHRSLRCNNSSGESDKFPYCLRGRRLLVFRMDIHEAVVPLLGAVGICSVPPKCNKMRSESRTKSRKAQASHYRDCKIAK